MPPSVENSPRDVRVLVSLPTLPKHPTLGADEQRDNELDRLASKIARAIKPQEDQPADEPIATGLRPRGLLLPALVLVVLLAPVVGLVLPVGLASSKEVRVKHHTHVYLCALGSLGTSNPTAAQQQAWKAQLQQTCAEASGQVWEGQAPKAEQYNVSKELNRGWMLMDVAVANVDTLALTAQANADISFSQLAAAFNASAVDPNADQRMLQDQRLLQDPASTESHSSSTSNSPPAQPPPTDPPPCPCRKKGQKKGAQASAPPPPTPAPADDVPQMLQEQASNDSLFAKIQTGSLTGARKKLALPASTTLDVMFTSSTGSDVSLKTGDRGVQRQLRINMQAITALFSYPFDHYRIPIRQVMAVPGYVRQRLVVYAGNDTHSYAPVPVLVRVGLSSSSWRVSVRPGQAAGDQSIDEATWTTFLNFDIEVQRTGFNRFFAGLVLTGMWILSSCAIVYGIDLLYLRPRNASVADGGLFTGLLFSLNVTRGVMPGVPPVGQAVDYFGFIWMMVFMMICNSFVYAKVISQYIHDKPTLYDKLFKTPALEEWEKKQAVQEGNDKKQARRKKDDYNGNHDRVAHGLEDNGIGLVLSPTYFNAPSPTLTRRKSKGLTPVWTSGRVQRPMR